jgi:hypothetical protein
MNLIPAKQLRAYRQSDYATMDWSNLVASSVIDAETLGLKFTAIEGAISAEVAATNSEVTRLNTELAAEIGATDSEVTRLNAELASEIADTNSEVTRLDAELASEIAATDSEVTRLDGEVSRINGELAAEIAATDSEVTRLDGLVAKLDTDIIVESDFAMASVNGPTTPGDSVSEVVAGEIIHSSVEVFCNGIMVKEDFAIAYAAGNTTIKLDPSNFDLDQYDKITFKYVKISA